MMGSLNASASGIPVVAKTNTTFRKGDIKIVKSDSVGDTETVLVSGPVTRTISSGSIVRDDGTVQYHQDLVYGLYMGGRSADVRIPSEVGVTRDISVAQPAGSGTVAVIPSYLDNDIPQLSMKHTGNKIVEGQSVGDTVVSRVEDSGVFDLGWPF